jgi:hypothetical protein
VVLNDELVFLNFLVFLCACFNARLQCPCLPPVLQEYNRRFLIWKANVENLKSMDVSWQVFEQTQFTASTVMLAVEDLPLALLE